MKKLIITLTVGLSFLMFTTSCRWIHETFYSVEGCAEWYAEELYDAAADEDKKEFIERFEQMDDWRDDLSSKDKKRAYRALEEWADDHKAKARCISDFAESHNID
jgi:hypothetical protein